MGDIQNVSGEAAIKKIKELAEEAKTCMLSTKLSQVPFSTRPMAIQDVDEHGCIWFFSASDSDKNVEISEDERAQLIFMNNSSYEYLSLFGDAAILTDLKRAEEL